MKEYTFRVTQPATSYFEGSVTIKAKNKHEAKRLLEEMPQKELDNICTNWEVGASDPNGDIKIDES